MAGTRVASMPSGLAAALLRGLLVLVVGVMAGAGTGEEDREPAPSPASDPSRSTDVPAGVDDDSARPDEAPEDSPPQKPRRVGPVVRSVNEAADRLRPPGESPYEEPIDWRSLPPWQKTSFFGVRAKGTFFVFVVDCSGSMSNELRLERAKQELRRAIAALRHPQRYLIIFFNDRALPMPGGVPRSTEHRGKRSTFSWLRSIEPEGGTDPRGAMNLALGLKPDAVFLLSDGVFRPGTESAILSRNPGSVPIHCIDLSGGIGEAQLRAIAEGSGGRYASRR